MVTIIMSMIGWGLLDSLNPSTIATMILLMPLVTRRQHAWYYIGATFFIYFLFGLLSLWGAERFVAPLIMSIMVKVEPFIGWLELAAAVLMLGFGITLAWRSWMRWKRKVPLPNWVGRSARFVNPVSLLLLAAGSTLVDLPTALPYGAFIATLATLENQTTIEPLFLLIYSFLYILPMILVYIVFVKLDNSRYQLFEVKFKRVMNATIAIAMPLLLIGFSSWLLTDCLRRLLHYI
ncbi:GAP family protein [Paenibacillus urinalis]|uniref:GAP family protein n=2 Tax=Paenibacillus TaxID=44249 RepID=A0AAX3N1C1_9BACL|nr:MULTISPECIES: GAP family protein [Paenibacillus]WDH82515.1 GAP family protein [Paenibacillus urinalis]WDH98569.1 GAP family protein [Paenibacillus urinalis]WDI02261.1 GAP family protein [Paenibacillus urinalis]SDW89736.1 Sap, sulfolipid-1-addressing protein [Paenibacillus sp. PDC88]